MPTASARGVLSAAVNAETVTPCENTGLAVSEGGYAEYTLDIPKTALYYISLKYSYLTDTSKVNELAFSFELNGEKPFEEAGPAPSEEYGKTTAM